MRKLGKREIFAILLILMTVGLRLLWIGDMEFKADEKYTAHYLATLSSRPFAPATDPSGHAGISHSNGFYYFLNALPFDYADPLVIDRTIAGLNAVAIALPLWFLRGSPVAFLAFAMAGSSVSLIQGSRKIWYPDLVPFWIHLGFALFLAARRKAGRFGKAALAGSAFSFAVAGHMYLPGVMMGGLASLGVFLFFFRLRQRENWLPWLLGMILGGLTYLPYALLVLGGAQGTRGAGSTVSTYDFHLFEPILRDALLLPSTFSFMGLYLRSIRPWLAGISTQGYGLGPLGHFSMLFWFYAAGISLVLVFWSACFLAFQNRREAYKDPLVLTFVAILLLVPCALFFSRLGSYLHYWLGAMPFAFYFIAWSLHLKPDSAWTRRGIRLAWLSCLFSILAAVHFAVLVHRLKGLPGEYGPSYRSQIPEVH